MRRRLLITFRPDLDPLEAKQPLSAGVSTAMAATHAVEKAKTAASSSATPLAVQPHTGYLVYRIGQPKTLTVLKPPFQQVLVQKTQPVPGQTYNILQIAVRNGTAQTFTSSSNFTVQLSGQTTETPILTGNETWQPNQYIVFYVLSKKYYPIQNTNAGGFIFHLDGAYSLAIPGPSAIFLRLKYDPKTFAHTLDSIVAYGQGSQNATGNRFGVPNTAIWTFVSAKTQRIDFGGYF
jgi:hypothetical protein